MGSTYIFLWWTKVSFAFLIAYVLPYVIVLSIIYFALADGTVIACLDVLQITHAAISLVNFMFESHKIHDKRSFFNGYCKDKYSGYPVCRVTLFQVITDGA